MMVSVLVEAIPAMSAESRIAVAAEFDAYFNGVCIYFLIGEHRFDFDNLQRSLLVVASARFNETERKSARLQMISV